MSDEVVVVGAGLSGLAAAHRLSQAGRRVIVLERESVVGGCALTVRERDYVVDTGPDVMNSTYAHTLALARELGLGGDIVRCSQVVDFIRDGRPIEVDRARPWTLLRSPLLPLRSKLSLACGYLRLLRRIRSFDAYAMSRYAEAQDQGNAYDFASKYFDDEVIDYLLDPMLRAFAGTDVRKASALAVLGVLAIGSDELVNIRGGMDQLPRTLAANLDVRCGSTVTAVEDTGSGVGVTYVDDHGAHHIDADACVVAVNYHQAQQFWAALDEVAPGYGGDLVDIPMLSVSLGYDTPARTRAYSVMLPTVECPDAILLLMQQHKSDDRAPGGSTLATIYTEAVVTERLMSLTDDDVAAWAAARIEGFYPELTGHRNLAVVTRWGHTGYHPGPGYWKGINEVRKALPRGRIHTSGALFGSGGVERAILGGERAAARLIATTTTQVGSS